MKNMTLIALLGWALTLPLSGYAADPVVSPSGNAPTTVSGTNESPSVQRLEKKIARKKHRLEKMEKKLEEKKAQEATKQN